MRLIEGYSMKCIYLIGAFSLLSNFIILQSAVCPCDHLVKNALIENRNFDPVSKKPLAISLGFCCAVASTMEVNGLRHYAFPFDWVWTPFKGLCEAIKNDFSDFLNSDFLVPSGRALFNTKYSISFHHDFPVYIHNSLELLTEDYLNYLEEVQVKYKRRINRFCEALNSTRPTFLIRARYTPLENEAICKDEVILLRDILLEKFPDGNWTLVVLDVTDDYKEDWQLDRVRNFYLHNEVDPWGGGGGDSKAWKTIFKMLNLL